MIMYITFNQNLARQDQVRIAGKSHGNNYGETLHSSYKAKNLLPFWHKKAYFLLL